MSETFQRTVASSRTASLLLLLLSSSSSSPLLLFLLLLLLGFRRYSSAGKTICLTAASRDAVCHIWAARSRLSSLQRLDADISRFSWSWAHPIISHNRLLVVMTDRYEDRYDVVIQWHIWVSQGSVAEGLNLLGCCIASADKYLATFRRWCFHLQS